MNKLLQRLRDWRQRRKWAAMHLEWLRTMVYGDARWLASNPIASALTERYEAALRDDWYVLDHEDTPRLRTRLGLDPSRATAPTFTHRNKMPSNPAAAPNAGATLADADPMTVYRAACDVRDWANALGTVLEDKLALIASIDRLRAMVAAPAQQAGAVAHWTDGWSPIKSAPRDGTNILIRFGEHDGISQAKYIAGLPHPWQFIDTNDGVTWLINHSVDAPGGPSHWRHLDAATLAQPQADAALEKACDLLSMTVGMLMSCRPKIGYVDNSPIAKLAAEVVEFLAPWPEKMPQADAAVEPVRWGDPETIGMFIRQLQTIDPQAPIYAAFHIDYQGKRRAMVRGVTLSRERVKGRFIEAGDTSVPYAHVVWSQPQADAAEPVSSGGAS